MEQLGIQPIQLISQIINFAVIIYLLNRFLYKPVVKVLDDRRHKIEASLKQAEKMKEEMEKQERKQGEIMQKAREEAKTVIADAKAAAKLVEAEIIEKAHKEAATITQRAQKDIETQRAEMEKTLKNQTVEIAGAMAQKILADVLSDQQAVVVDKKIRDLTKLKA